MKILVIGSGGREHALCWAIKQSQNCEALFCAPGNPGTAELATNISIKADDVSGIVEFAITEKIDLVVVGPEVPLTLGLADELTRHGIACFGPSRVAAMLEGSKAFSKLFLQEANIPTARSETFTDYESALKYLDKWNRYPVVVKASGLAAGKGVVIAQNRAEAEHTLTSWLRENTLGESGKTVVIEEFLDGEEASLFVVSDGVTFQILPPAQDHKRLLENDRGPNTGGMGACAPSPAITEQRLRLAMERVVEPTFTRMTQRGTPFTGVLFIGLMFVGDDPYVLEYNVRFGDPEAQVLMPLLNCDVTELLYASATGTLAALQAKNHWSSGIWRPLARPDASVFCVVLSSRGYPVSPATNDKILLLNLPTQHELSHLSKGISVLFHAGTKRDDSGALRTYGGRVLNAVGIASDVNTAREAAYALANGIRFPGKHYRKDIGERMLAGLGINQPNPRSAKLVVLGSSSGMSSIERGSSAYWLETGETAYLLDAGEGVSRSILRQNVDYNKLKAVFISHTHPDHVSGLSMLLQMLHLSERKKPLSVYLPPDKVDIFTRYFQHMYLHSARLSFPYRFLPLGPEHYQDDIFRLDVFSTKHLLKYRDISEPLGIGILSQGFRITVGDRVLVYPSDIPDLDSIANVLTDSDLLLIETTHVPVEKLAAFAAKNRIPRVILTHIPPTKTGELEAWKQLGNTHSIPLWEVAYDGFSVEF